jgi:hypothetical protein
MSDLTPPPDEPLPEQSRHRIRAELLESVQRRPDRPQWWVVPGVAAAAVLLVVGLAGWAVTLGGRDSSDAPAATTTASASPTPADESAPGAATETPTETASVPSSPSPPPEGHPAGKGSCAEELVNVLPGAEQAVDFGDGTSFWVRGDRFVLCDVRAGTTTVHHPLPMSPADQVSTYAVSSTYPPTPGGFRTVNVAGGIVPEGLMAFDVRYTFPNGGTAAAETTTDEQGRTWWRMVHAFYGDGGNEMDHPPITVRVRYSGVEKNFELQWGLDTCAQANHGC